MAGHPYGLKCPIRLKGYLRHLQGEKRQKTRFRSREALQEKQKEMAERAGFEPAVAVIPRRRFSKPLLSTTQPSLRPGRGGQ